MVASVLKCAAMRFCKLLLVLLLLVHLAAMDGSAASTLVSAAASPSTSSLVSSIKANNYPTPTNERTRRDVAAELASPFTSALSSSSSSSSSASSPSTASLTLPLAQQSALQQDVGNNQNSNSDSDSDSNNKNYNSFIYDKYDKSNSNSNNNNNNNNIDNHINDNNANNDKDKHNLPFNIGNPLRALNIVKRAPNGFTGVRGKKDYESTDYNSVATGIDGNGGPNTNVNSIDWDIDPLQQAMWDNDFNMPGDMRYKKTPAGFYGVRGKKYTGGEFNRIDGILQKLEAERLREAILDDFLSGLATRTNPQNEITKRAPTGFMGMRGKRPTMDLYDDETLLEEKRGPVNAFVGVRGKKDVNHQTFKRSPIEPNNRRSKSQRFVDFNNKFVAVRGKKSDTTDTTSSNEYSLEQQHFTASALPTTAGAHEKFYVNMQWLPVLGGRGKRDTRAYGTAFNDFSLPLSSTYNN